MRNAVFALALAGGILAGPFAAQAADGVVLGQPQYGGTGCPQGSATAALSPNGQIIAVLFDAFSATAGGPDGGPFARAACSLAIPVTVPAGLSVAVFPVDFAGFNHLPDGAAATVRVEYFFAGDTGTPVETVFTGPLDGDFLVQHPLPDDATEWSACGSDVILRANASVVLTTTGSDAALSTVEAAVGYRLQTKSC